MRSLILSLGMSAAACGLPSVGTALEDGTHRVFLQDGSGARFHVADLDVKNNAYTVDMKAEPFSDHFLSMRPFKCLDGADKTWCHVPYPYEIARNTSAGLTDLEYDFLFLWKASGEYGIDMWNGIYYKLEETGQGGLIGRLHEMDMDILSVPPDAGNLRLIREVDLEPGEPDSHWLPVLVVDGPD